MKTPFELVTDNVEITLAGITQADGFNNDLEVVRESKDGSSPSPSNPQARVARLVPGEILYYDGSNPEKHSPVSYDDFDMVFWIDCYEFEPENSELTPDAVGHSIAADVFTALNADYQRGTHPTIGQPNALNTKLRFATPMEQSQSAYRGVVVRAEVHVRVKKNRPSLHWLSA